MREVGSAVLRNRWSERPLSVVVRFSSTGFREFCVEVYLHIICRLYSENAKGGAFAPPLVMQDNVWLSAFDSLSAVETEAEETSAEKDDGTRFRDRNLRNHLSNI